MSCRSTKAGTVAHRIARNLSGLPDKTVQTLFHSLKREGAGLPDPSPEELEAWRIRMRDLIDAADLTPAQRERSEHDLFLARDEIPDGATFYSWSGIEARARQEAALRGVKGMVVDLEEPGAQAANYELGPDGRPVKVWYASYGSNLDRGRFLTYIAGGTPEGSGTHHEGARDKTLPEDDIAIRFHGRMHFAASSNRWGGGGVAFMDSDTAGHALGRAYEIGMEQFDDVVAQENGRKPGDLTVPVDEALAAGKSKATIGLYGTLVHIGDYNNAPVFTFTGSFSAQEALHSQYDEKSSFLNSTNVPSDNYLRMVGSGLSETFGMSVDEQADYLRGSLGAHTLNREALVHVLSTPPDKVELRAKYKPVKASKKSSRRRALGTSLSDRWTDEWDSYRSDSYNNYSSWYDEPRGPHARPGSFAWYADDSFQSEFEDEPSVNWWDYDTAEEYEAALSVTNYQRDGQVYRKLCAYCGEHGHKMHDCPHL